MADNSLAIGTVILFRFPRLVRLWVLIRIVAAAAAVSYVASATAIRV